MKEKRFIGGHKFITVEDRHSEKYGDEVSTLLCQRVDEYGKAGGVAADIQVMSLFEPLDKVLEIGHSVCEQCNGNLIFDVTSLPKRFWFPLMKWFIRNTDVENLVVTYTRAATYTNDGHPLFEDIATPMDVPLPGFGGQRTGQRMWVASAGFMVDSLSNFAGNNSFEDLRILFPFPAPLENVRREWLSIAKLQDNLKEGRFQLVRVDPRNVSSCFDRLLSFSRTSCKALAFAPFGPKPMSIAMCIYASLDQTASVHYPQPSVYHPRYSSGIYQNEPTQAIDAYLIKCGGDNLYEVPRP